MLEERERLRTEHVRAGLLNWHIGRSLKAEKRMTKESDEALPACWFSIFLSELPDARHTLASSFMKSHHRLCFHQCVVLQRAGSSTLIISLNTPLAVGQLTNDAPTLGQSFLISGLLLGTWNLQIISPVRIPSCWIYEVLNQGFISHSLEKTLLAGFSIKSFYGFLLCDSQVLQATRMPPTQ